MYGIYDLSGGICEKTSAYIANGDQYLRIFNSSYTVTTANNNVDKISTKYATVYKYNTTIDNGENNRVENVGAYGDAVLEISSGEGSTSWNGDYSYFACARSPIVYRGGLWDHASSGIIKVYRNFIYITI